MILKPLFVHQQKMLETIKGDCDTAIGGLAEIDNKVLN